MRIRLITVSHKLPDWLIKGYQEYAKRLPSFCQLELIEISAEKRTHASNLQKIQARESEKILNILKPQNHVVALDRLGKQFTTEELAEEINHWCNKSINVDLLIGGPEGLSTECLDKANFKWSLSKLTFPHTLVRVILAEQIYRACSIIQHHPYHR